MVRLFFVMLAGFVVGVVALVAGLIVGGLVTYEMTRPLFTPPRVNYQRLEFPSSKATIYLAAQRWGMTGDSEEVRICTTPIDLGYEGTCLKFYTDELFYGRTGSNGLVVHAYSIPIYEVTKLGVVDIKIHQLDNDKLEAMRRDYDRRGLMRISAP